MNKKKSIQVNNEILLREIEQMEKQYWERSRFCSCGADKTIECECAADKKKRYKKRVSRKLNEELGPKAAKILYLKNKHL